MIHTYKLNGYNIVLDPVSGSVHLVDDVAYDVISLYPIRSEGEIIAQICKNYPELSAYDVKECLAEIEELKNKGLLFSDDGFRPDVDKLAKRDSVIKAMCLHVAHSCNLNCEYCFASQGKYHGERALMSFEVGKRALDFLIENSGERHNLEVDFFGGEPLMNLGVVKQLVEYARSVEAGANKHFRFTLTTNGVLLDDETNEFLNREMDNVVLSLDGRRETHDRFRKTVNGQGSWDTVVPKFRKLVDSRGGKNYYVRGTFTAANTDFTEDILAMADLGFTELSMEPVICAPDEKYALKEEDLPKLKRQYELLACRMLERKREGKPITFYHYMLDLEAGPCIYKRISGCGSGTEYLAVTPEGDFYPCHQFVGESEYMMGDVFNGITNAKLRDKFKRCNVYSHKECEDCWAKFYCSGGCAANAYHATGDINGVYSYGCELFKKRIECAVMLQAAQAVEIDEEETQSIR